jgi:hypothetical protein
MPSYRGKLTPAELNDLVSYLSSLKFWNTMMTRSCRVRLPLP